MRSIPPNTPMNMAKPAMATSVAHVKKRVSPHHSMSLSCRSLPLTELGIVGVDADAAHQHGEEDEDEEDVVDCDGDVPVSEAKS